MNADEARWTGGTLTLDVLRNVGAGQEKRLSLPESGTLAVPAPSDRRYGMVLLQDVLTDASAAELTTLCGAGVSTPPPSSIPTVSGFIQSCMDATSAPASLCEAIAKRLLLHPLPRFEVLIEQLRSHWDTELRIARIFDSPHSTDMHSYLAHICNRGAAVVTTNFDNCIERSCKGVFDRVVFDGHDLQDMPHSSGALVKVHGSHSLESTIPTELVMSISSLARTARGFFEYPKWRSYLRRLLDHRILLVLGYSGSDDFDLMPVLSESTPRSVLWLQYDADAGAAFETRHDALAPNIVSTFRTDVLRVFRGTFDTPVRRQQAVGSAGTKQQESTSSPSRLMTLTTTEWVAQLFPTMSDKRCLLATIALHHGVHAEARSLLKKAVDPRECSLRARAEFFASDYREALTTLAALNEEQLPLQLRAQNAHVESACHSYLGDHALAIDAAYKFLTYAQQLTNGMIVVEAKVNLAATLAFGKRYPEAEQEYRRAELLLADSPNLEALAKVHWGLADVALVGTRYDAALRGYESALQIFDKLGGETPIAWIRRSYGEALVFLRRLDEADIALVQAEEIFRRHGHREGLAYVALDRSRLEWLRGDHVACLAYSRAAIGLLDNNVQSPIAINSICMAWLAGEATGSPYRLSQLLNDFDVSADRELAEIHTDDPAASLLASLLHNDGVASKADRDAIESVLFPT